MENTIQDKKQSLVDLQKAKMATQAIFLVCGFGISSWAPMVPFAKDRLGLNDGSLGLLLLFLGAGAITTMPLSSYLISKIGSRNLIVISAFIIAVTLPLLLIIHSVVLMAAILYLFGVGIGNIDVAMNAHGVQVQNLYNKPIMSSLHGLFSVGGLCGSLGIGFLIRLGLEPLMAAMCISILLLTIVLIQTKHLMDKKIERQVIQKFSDHANATSGKRGSWLNKSIIILGLMCFAVFLSEGAMLDWSAIFLRDSKEMDKTIAGVGYASFSIAMAGMRLVGDRIVSRIDGKFVVIYGALLGAVGIALAILTPWIAAALLGFILLGIGLANIVPVFFSEGGRLKEVSSSIAIPAITTMGYAGQLAGPAILGFVAHHFSLPVSLGVTGFLLLFVAIIYSVKQQAGSTGKLAL